jgi:hypothetical protein
MRYKARSLLICLILCLVAVPANGQRIMEKLGRGFVAVGGGTGGTLLSWRLYGPEQGTDIAFNVYKGTTKLNATPIVTSTNYQDNASGTGTYTVKAIIGGVEEATGTTAMDLPKGYLEIPLKAAAGRNIHLAYVGDLDGDGEYEYVVDRFGNGVSQYVDAYHRTTGFMWRVDMGPNSTNTDLSLSGPGTISCGHADNEAVFDVDSDGKGEVVLRGANGMIFGDGKVLVASTTQTDSFIVAIDGVTGAEKGKEAAVPQDLIATGNVTGHFSSPYWDGVHPSLYFKGKAGGTKAMMDMGFDFKNGAWSLRFKAVRSPIGNYPNFHQVRCLDLNQDGKDECINGGYAIDGAGTVLWNQASMGGVVHGDRWHVGDLDPARPGLEGFSVSQNATSYDWFTWDAKDGSIIRKYGAGGTDMGRGTCGDVDPNHKGYECWTGGKVFAVSEVTGAQIGTTAPPQNVRIFWDGDVLSENLDSTTVSKWDYPGKPTGGFTSVNLGGLVGPRQAVPLYGDMFGDWREEVLAEQSGGTTMRIYSTAIPTDKRIYTLMHDPEYRNSMNEKGYIQSHMLDYYLGDGMTDPPKPNMTYPNTPGGGSPGTGGTIGSGGADGSTTIPLGGAPGGGGTVVGSGGIVLTGGITQVGGGGSSVVRTGGMSSSGGAPGTGGRAGGAPATGGNTPSGSGGAATGSGGTTVGPGSAGGAGTGGAAGAQSSTVPIGTGTASGCSCAMGASSGRASSGALSAMLVAFGLVTTWLRRRRLRR